MTTTTSTEPVQMDIHRILHLLPHRYPFLLVDRVLECRAWESIRAIKNVSINEPFFQGHFPYRPIMPGVLILEAMAQATGLLAFHSLGENAEQGIMYMLVGVDKARFKRPVEAGDQLLMEIKLARELKGIYRFEGTASVEERVVCSAEFMTTKKYISRD
jgi:3-hydroxyacyl-[acyl-carrier-protein] dehydratase